MRHLALLLALLLGACSNTTYHIGRDGSVLYSAGNVLDRSDWEVSALVGQGALGTLAVQRPVLGANGQVVAMGTTMFDFPPGSVIRITEGGDRTQVAREGLRGYFSFRALQEWIRGDVAKAAEVEQTARVGAGEAGLTERARVGAIERLGQNPEASPDVIGAAAGALR